MTLDIADLPNVGFPKVSRWEIAFNILVGMLAAIANYAQWGSLVPPTNPTGQTAYLYTQALLPLLGPVVNLAFHYAHHSQDTERRIVMKIGAQTLKDARRRALDAKLDELPSASRE